MFGIPFSGGSVCGMQGSQSAGPAELKELCAYWFQLAAWVPFAYQNIDNGTKYTDITALPDLERGAATAAL